MSNEKILLVIASGAAVVMLVYAIVLAVRGDKR
jgi:hypothetical protein